MSIQNRFDIVYFFDITDGNPNGDPDAGNLPRVDPETGQGLVTDVCLKRKIRNFVGLHSDCQPPNEIYVREKAVLNEQHARAWEAVAPDVKPAERSKLSKAAKKEKEITRWMCQNFFDIRTFGAVMTTKVNCGQVRGPVQIGFARSIHPVISQEHAVTRCAVTTEAEAKKQEGDNRTIGRKYTIPYGLYRAHIYISPHLADKTGFGDDDLAMIKQSLNQMFEIDRSAARANMRPVKCVAFKHDSKLGNTRADELFDRVTVDVVDGVQPSPETLRKQNAAGESFASIEGLRPPRDRDDYQIQIDEADLPEGVTAEVWV